MKQNLRCYDIVLADLNNNMTFNQSEQSGVRPCVIIQNLLGQIYSSTTIVFPLSSRINKNSNQSTHTILRKENGSGIKQDSIVLGEAIRQIDEKRIIKYIGRVVNPEERKELKRVYNSIQGFDE